MALWCLHADDDVGVHAIHGLEQTPDAGAMPLLMSVNLPERFFASKGRRFRVCRERVRASTGIRGSYGRAPTARRISRGSCGIRRAAQFDGVERRVDATGRECDPAVG